MQKSDTTPTIFHPIPLLSITKKHRQRTGLLYALPCAILCTMLLCACSQEQNPPAASTVFSATEEPAERLRESELLLDLSSDDFAAQTQEQIPLNPHTELSVPTYITKVKDTYFIVDCYHNQVIYHDNLQDPLTDWKVMTSEISQGHTLASDGSVYLIDDTENNRILIFEKKDGIFYHTQTFAEIGNRPHYIIYHKSDATFYVWSSMSGEMYLLRHDADNTRMYLSEIRTIPELQDTYVRSFTILDGDIYFVSGIPGNSAILRADLETFEIEETYAVPDTLAGMIQLTRIEDAFYITVSTDINGSQDAATILRTDKLENLAGGNYEDIYASFIGGGTPYYITQIDGLYYLTEHRLPGHSIWSFHVDHGELCDITAVY